MIKTEFFIIFLSYFILLFQCNDDCVLCPAGTFSGNCDSNCGPGNCTEIQKCKNCTSGYFAETGSAKCQPCPLGHYALRNGSEECLPCKSGTYANKIATKICLPCGKNYISPKNGSQRCVPCLTGSETLKNGSTTCIFCKSGYFNDKNGSNCRSCQFGYYTTIMGAITCHKCPEGYYCPFANQLPKPCPYYSICPSGSYIPFQCQGRYMVPKKNKQCVPSTGLIIMICFSILFGMVILYLLFYFATWINRNFHYFQYPVQTLGERSPILRSEIKSDLSGY